MGATTGTLTFLFTDIEGSTERWQSDRDAMASALADHDATLARTIEAHGGRLFKHTGDGMCAVFESARQAVAAAVAAQEELDLAVRMGIHTGEAEERDGDYFGPTLNRCARIMDAGHGRQILVSRVTQSLLDDVETIDLGEHDLKGLDRRERIFQLGVGEFPPLRVASRSAHLPTATTSLIGREELTADVVDRLGGASVVTLTGVGGVGKTRLALAVADRMVGDVELTVFVDLAAIGDDDDVLPATARALGVTTPTFDAIGIALADRPTLIVLDNCEHVLLAAADLAEDMLASSGAVRVLATSREGLGIPGEQIIAVPGLGAGEGGDISAATELFVDRATALDRRFAPTPDDLATINEICRRLDGLPLAIELAAARVGVLGIPELLARLDERFQLLTGGRRRRSRDRQRTLRDAIDWSYDLLAPDEQEAFAILSVFATSFGLDEAAAVLDCSELEALDLVQALVDKSLLNVTEIEGAHRFRYLETVRAYAEERLGHRTDAAAVSARLHAHLVDVIRESVDAVFNRPSGGADRIRIEIPNLRRSFDDALGRGDAAAAAALIAPLAELIGVVDWHVSGWAQEALQLPGVAGTPLELDLLAVHTVDMWLERRFDLLHDLGERLVIGSAGRPPTSHIEVAAVTAFRMTGDDAASSELTRQRIDRLGGTDPGRTIYSRLNLASVSLSPFDPAERAGFHAAESDRAIDDGLRSDAPAVRGWARLTAGLRSLAAGDFESALDHAVAAMDLCVTGSGIWFGSLQLTGLAELRLGRRAEACRTADADLDHAYRCGDRSAMIIPVILYAMLLQGVGEHEAAATLRGFLPRRMTLMFITELTELDQWLSEAVPDDRRRELAATGRQMSARELQALTHDVLRRHIDLEAVTPRP